MKRRLFWLILVIGVLSVGALLDFGFGLWRDFGEIRRSTHKFRSEAVPLETSTRHLLPHISHEYSAEDRPKGDPFSPSYAPRVVRTGSDGMVLGTHEAAKPWRSILFLGGSTTENNEVDEPFRFPYLVAKYLTRTLGADVEGLNGGVRGHTTQESLSLLLNHPAPGINDASVVVVMHNINDRLLLALQKSYKSKLQTWSPLTWLGVSKSAEYFLNTLFENLRYRSNILFVLEKVISDYVTNSGPHAAFVTESSIDIPDSQFEESKRKFRSNLEVFVVTIRSMGKTPVLMTQPLGRESKFQDGFNEIIRQVGTRDDVTVIDLDSQIANQDRSSLFYSDAIHFTNSGSIWAATIIAKDLEEKLFRAAYELPSTPLIQAVGDACNMHARPDPSPQTAPPNLLDIPGRYPSIDPTGRKLLSQFVNEKESRVELLDLFKGQRNTLAATVAPSELRHPSWGPGRNPQYIIYGSLREGFEALYRMDLRNKRAEPLVRKERFASAIATVGRSGAVYFAGYSVDANGVALESPDIYVLNPKTTAPKRLTFTKWEEWRPFIAPSERELYFISNRDGHFDIFRMNLRTQVIDKVVGGGGDKWDPATSPDGRWLTFASRKNSNFDIFLLDLTKASTPIRITRSIEDEWDPRFSSDGNALLYATTSSGGSRIRGVCISKITGRR